MLSEVRATYPKEYGTVHAPTLPVDESTIESHTLLPEAMKHAFLLLSSLLRDDLPLGRRQHEMIATVVSETNGCFY